VRCEPSGGCQLVYQPASERTVVDGRPVGRGEALLLLATQEDFLARRAPNAIYRVSLETGQGQLAYLLEPGESFRDIDWISTASPAPPAD